jgi:hypothetical protein
MSLGWKQDSRERIRSNVECLGWWKKLVRPKRRAE